MTRIWRISHTTFAALSVPNYRRYLGGQSISLVGTWMQMTAQAWLVLQLTGSPEALGVIVALQTLPVLLLGPYGGVIADRVDKRRLMIVLQSAMGVQALALGLLTVTGVVEVWEIGLLAALLGLNNAFENPSRQSFMLELVGPEHLRNAVSLNSTTVNVARMIGPAVAGLLIASVGDGACFLINAGSFVAVVASLATMDMKALTPVSHLVRGAGQLREGLSYVRRTPGIAVPLVMMGVVGCLAYEFQVTLPYMAQHGLHAGPSGFGFMTAAMGVGAVVGGLVAATRGQIGIKPLVLASALFGIPIALAAIAPSLALELVALALVGGASIGFMTTGNSTLQLRADPEMRGRVMALWFVAFQGSTPIGGPIVGLVMGWLGARAGLGLGAVTCFVAAGGGALAVRVLHERRTSADASASDNRRAADEPDARPGTNGFRVGPSVPIAPDSAPVATLGLPDRR
jgi:MFS family permease